MQKKVLSKKGATHIAKPINKQQPTIPSIVNPLVESFKSDYKLLALLVDETLYMDMEKSPCND